MHDLRTPLYNLWMVQYLIISNDNQGEWYVSMNRLIKRKPLKEKIVVICGGAKGMGKALAKIIVQLGGSLCIIDIDSESLKKTNEELINYIGQESQFITTITCDTREMNELKSLLTSFIEKNGIPDYLINVVGCARPDYVENYTLQDFEKLMNENYYGQLIPTLILLPYFMEEKKGHVINFTSALGYFGMMGYTTYSPSKFALVGLTEALRHELKPYNIRFSLIYPTDTDTPGYAEENKTKPEECALISTVGKLANPDEVAEKYIKSILKKKFYILTGMAKIGWKLKRHLPRLYWYYFDRAYKKAIKEVGKMN
ncbi:MAG: SDR family NAD(P)-dependent oxidoreductase [Promethearchaeota archaeon]